MPVLDPVIVPFRDPTIVPVLEPMIVPRALLVRDPGIVPAKATVANVRVSIVAIVIFLSGFISILLVNDQFAGTAGWGMNSCQAASPSCN